MSGLRRALWQARWMALVFVLLSVMALPSAQAAKSRSLVVPDSLLTRLSQGAAIRYLQAHPEQAPERLAQRLESVRVADQSQANAAATAIPAGVGVRFNADNFGLPQNEESITACADGTTVLGGTNDYRGLLDRLGNFTGWHFSNDGGVTLANEGLLPPVRIHRQSIPSGGDPVTVADENCVLYAGSLTLDPADLNPNGIGVYRTTPQRLANCPGGNDPSCWPVRRAVAVGRPGHFLDKEWVYAGPNGSGGTAVWVVYTDFLTTGPGELDFTASIKAVRCNADLSRCTDPIRISGDDRDVQFGDVTIAPNGRVFITWSQVQGELSDTEQTFIHKLRTAPAGSTNFGSERIVHRERKAIPFGGFLNANDFRVATYPKNEVRVVGGRPRVFVVWDACSERPLPTVCELPVIKLKTSDDLGATWSDVRVVSEEGGNYFPTISNDAQGTSLAIAYFTNREDPAFDNRQDIELLTLDPVTSQVTNRQLLTSLSNEPESDPALGGFFIGDYIEVFASGGDALVHYNANYRQIPFLRAGPAVPQQDNFLIRANL